MELSENGCNNYSLKQKLGYVLNTPVIDNSISRNSHKLCKNYLTITTWNIERGFEIDKIISVFNNPDYFLCGIKKSQRKNLNKIKSQIQIINDSDIIILNEVDIGLPRTAYRNIAEELAKALGYNYVYGVEFLELDPSNLGTGDSRWSEKDALVEDPGFKLEDIDAEKYKGLHGNAILSRFELGNARILRLPSCHNWYYDEKNELCKAEIIRRIVSKKIFNHDILREIRAGGRIALIADVAIPDFDFSVTIVSTHLEDRCSPKCRNKQVKFILNSIKNIENPVILGGDFNTSNHNLCPMGSRLAAKGKEKEVLKTISKTKFCDGQKIDKSGEKNFSNTNEKCKKGFKSTFYLKRSFGIAKYKTDWIFLKKGFGFSINQNRCYKLTPFYTKTLYEMNFSQKKPPSDHAPIVLRVLIN